MNLTWFEHHGTCYFISANQNMPSIYVLQYVETSVTMCKHPVVSELQPVVDMVGCIVALRPR